MSDTPDPFKIAMVDRLDVERTVGWAHRNHPGFVIVSGGAKGVDTWAEEAARSLEIPVDVVLPDWKKLKRGAGVVRNRDIVAAADLVVAFWDGKSKGTKSTIDITYELRKPIWIVMRRDGNFNFSPGSAPE